MRCSTTSDRSVDDLVWYVDTSAFVKLIVEEESSSALRTWYSSHDGLWSSQLLRTEALRAAQRLGIDRGSIEAALETVSLILPSVVTFASAGRLQPKGLRTLHALHLAAAREIGSDLEGMVAYDQRLIDAARKASIEVMSPT